MIDFLREKGELENTFILVTADNGMPFPYAKANVQEFGTHVPLAISLPNVIKGKEVYEPVGLIDLAPTLMELVGLEDAMTPTGKSLLPVLTNEEHSPHREYVLTEGNVIPMPDPIIWVTLPEQSEPKSSYMYITLILTAGLRETRFPQPHRMTKEAWLKVSKPSILATTM